MSLGVRQALKVYSGILGLFVSLFAFIWVFFMVYLVSDTPESEHDLRMARYLDICFGLFKRQLTNSYFLIRPFFSLTAETELCKSSQMALTGRLRKDAKKHSSNASALFI